MQNCRGHFTPSLDQPWGHPQVAPAQIWNIFHLGIHRQQKNCWGEFSLLCLNPPGTFLSYWILLLLPLHFKRDFFFSFFFSLLIWLHRKLQLDVGREWLLIKVQKMKPPLVAQEEKQLEMTSLSGQELQMGTNNNKGTAAEQTPTLTGGSLMGTNHPTGVNWISWIPPTKHETAFPFPGSSYTLPKHLLSP